MNDSSSYYICGFSTFMSLYHFELFTHDQLNDHVNIGVHSSDLFVLLIF